MGSKWDSNGILLEIEFISTKTVDSNSDVTKHLLCGSSCLSTSEILNPHNPQVGTVISNLQSRKLKDKQCHLPDSTRLVKENRSTIEDTEGRGGAGGLLQPRTPASTGLPRSLSGGLFIPQTLCGAFIYSLHIAFSGKQPLLNSKLFSLYWVSWNTLHFKSQNSTTYHSSFPHKHAYMTFLPL